MSNITVIDKDNKEREPNYMATKMMSKLQDMVKMKLVYTEELQECKKKLEMCEIASVTDGNDPNRVALLKDGVIYFTEQIKKLDDVIKIQAQTVKDFSKAMVEYS